MSLKPSANSIRKTAAQCIRRLESEDPAALDFITHVLGQNIAVRIKVTGRSMHPLVRSNDWVTLKRVSEAALGIGDLVFFIGPGDLPVLHRIVRRNRLSNGQITLRTKGDALVAMDGPISSSQVLGKVVQLEKYRRGRTIWVINLQSRNWKIISAGIARAFPAANLWLRFWRRIAGRRA